MLFYLEKNTPPQNLHVVPGFFFSLAYQGKDVVFRFIIEYSSF
jgi:hypothetical protein